MPSLKKNIFYSIVLVLANYVFPFLTYPYVSRVLGVTNIGACNFVDSVINYFALFSMLGVDSLGVREIAKCRGDKDSINKVFSNIFTVNLSLTALLLGILAILTYTVPQFQAHQDLMFLGMFKLLFNCLLVEWVYKGLEDFKLISLRSIIIKLLYVVSVFAFVKKREDVWIYYLLSTAMVVLNAAVNLAFSKGRFRIRLCWSEFLPTFRSLLTLGVYAILTSMYTTFNVTFLGFVSGDDEVGYYSTATKIYYMVMALFAAFTGVMMPRMSNLLSAGRRDEFKSGFSLALQVLFGFSFPLVAWMMVSAPDIVALIAGPGYEGAILPMRLVAPLIFIIGYEQILVIQTLIPLGKDKILLRNSIFGALLGTLLNIVLVPVFASVGSALVWILTELLILVLSQVEVTKEIDVRFPLSGTVRYLLAFLPLCLLLWGGNFLGLGLALRVILSVLLTAVYTLVFQTAVEKRDVKSILCKLV